MYSLQRSTPASWVGLVGEADERARRDGPELGGRHLERRSSSAATSPGSPRSTSETPRDVVEAQEHVGDDEPAHRQPGPGVRERHGRLELGDPVVADVADDGLVAALCLVDVERAASRSRRASSGRAGPGRPTRAGSSPRRARAGGGRPRAGSGGRCRSWRSCHGRSSVVTGKKKDPCGSSGGAGEAVVRVVRRTLPPRSRARTTSSCAGKESSTTHDRRSCLNPQAVPIPDLLRDLLRAAGPPGHEEPAAAVWRGGRRGVRRRCTSDTLGTSFARVRAGDGGRADARADRPHRRDRRRRHAHRGATACSPSRRSAASIPRCSSASASSSPGARGRCEGLIVAARRAASAASARALQRDDLHIDIGAAERRGRRRARSRRATRASGVGEPLELPNGRIVSKALDNRARRLRRARGGAPGRRGRRRGGRRRRGRLGAGGDRARRRARRRVRARARRRDRGRRHLRRPTSRARASRRAGRIELGSGRCDHARARRQPPRLRPARAGGRGGRDPARDRGALRAGRTPTPTTSTTRAAASRPASLSIPVRYMHSPCELAALDDLEAVIAPARRLRPATDARDELPPLASTSWPGASSSARSGRRSAGSAAASRRVPATELGAIAIRAALERAGIEPHEPST